jgi:hypothetical protein
VFLSVCLSLSPCLCPSVTFNVDIKKWHRVLKIEAIGDYNLEATVKEESLS